MATEEEDEEEDDEEEDDEEEEEEGEEEDEEEEEDDEEEDEELDEDMSALGEDDVRKGISSVATVNNPPAVADPRKNAGLPPAGQLYQVLETEAAGVGDALMGSDHRYVIPGQRAAGGGGPPPPAARAGGGREVTLRPDELDDALEGDDQGAFIADKYAEAGRAEREARLATREDFSDMVAEHTAGQKRKSESKKQKDGKKFKF